MLQTQARALARAIAFASFAVGATGAPNAGFITENEAGLDAVYGQASFGSNPIDIRDDSPLTIVDSALATIDSDAEMQDLGALGKNSPIVSAFFVDAIYSCGFTLGNIAGCAGVPGNVVVIDSTIASSSGFV